MRPDHVRYKTKELTDLAVAVFDSEKQNRERRLKKENTQEQTNR